VLNHRELNSMAANTRGWFDWRNDQFNQ